MEKINVCSGVLGHSYARYLPVTGIHYFRLCLYLKKKTKHILHIYKSCEPWKLSWLGICWFFFYKMVTYYTLQADFS